MVRYHAVGYPAQTADRGVSATHGNQTSKVVPAPGALSTEMAPACERTMPWTAAKPRPRPVDLVVKKGSKILARVAPDIPQPVSETLRRTYSPSTRPRDRPADSPVTEALSAQTVIEPDCSP